jgi:transposase
MSQIDLAEPCHNGHLLVTAPDPEVPPRAKRRQFSLEYKKRILEETDACTERGQVGALLRREGLYTSHLDKWRRQRDQGTLAGLAPKKRGRKAHPEAVELLRLRREKERLQAKLKRAETIIAFQKKLADLLGIPMDSPNLDEPSE